MSRIAATIATFLLAVFSYILVTACTDNFLLPAGHSSHQQKAAIAIRDAAPGYLQWGTEHFTVPYLEKYYTDWYYINEEPGNNHKKAFQNALITALKKYTTVDLYLLAHTNNYYKWVREIKPALRKNLRLVYNSGCEDLNQANTWLKLGAQTYIGHPGRSASPLFYFYFLRRWTRNGSIEHAVRTANNGMYKLLNIGGFFSPELNPTEVYDQSVAHISGNTRLQF
ncbi:MAG: hypothetical protein JNM68_12780 [Dinghuibacter sp.]|nr:hypothetical protein [Dinghuibacter sp.]